MNDLQYLIDRQLGIYSRYRYDNVLKRLVVDGAECFYGLQPGSAAAAASLDQDPPIFACRFSEASGYEHILALANEDGKVAIQDTSKASAAAALQSFQCHNNAVFDLAWAPRALSFVTVSGDHTACLWDAGQGAPRRVLVLASHARSVKTAAFRGGAPAVLATGARDGHVLVWDVRARAPALLLRPDSRLASCHAACAPSTPAHKRGRAEPRSISITGLVFQDDTTLISCGECDGNIKVWDLRKSYSVYKREPLPKHSIPYCGSSTKNGYTNLLIDDTGMRLYASCMDNVIYSYNISTYNSLPEQRYVGHENSTFYIKTSLSPDGMYLVSGSSDKNAYIWNVKYSQPVVKLVGHWAEVTCPAWCQKGDTKIVTCSDDARHKIWRIGKESIADKLELKGHAEVIPPTDITSLPQWGALERTPSSLKRKTTTPSSHNAKRQRTESMTVRKTKRCLTDLMNASRETDDCEITVKRLKLEPSIPEDEEPKLLPAGIKRHGDILDSPEHCSFASSHTSADWSYVTPKAGTSFMTPTKNYEKKTCKKLSPSNENRSPEKVSPAKIRIISFNTPTKNLPNFVLNGEAPHLRLMSPGKKKQDTTDWLTLMVREKRGKGEIAEKSVAAPLSPKENLPTRRNSVSEKTPKSIKKTRTLLTYFNVAKEK